LESILTPGLGDWQGSDDCQTCSQTDPFESHAAKQTPAQVIAIHGKPQSRIFLLPAAKPLGIAGPVDFLEAVFDLLFADILLIRFLSF
jgi:hypothetical protein